MWTVYVIVPAECFAAVQFSIVAVSVHIALVAVLPEKASEAGRF